MVVNLAVYSQLKGIICKHYLQIQMQFQDFKHTLRTIQKGNALYVVFPAIHGRLKRIPKLRNKGRGLKTFFQSGKPALFHISTTFNETANGKGESSIEKEIFNELLNRLFPVSSVKA